MRNYLALILILLWTTAARAGEVGVVVAGDASVQPQFTAQLEDWLRRNGHTLVPSPLPPEALNKVIDCFVIEDVDCARQVVETQATAPAIVFAKLELAEAKTGMGDVTITAYWFDRGTDVVTKTRTCERCTELTMVAATDALMKELSESRNMGKIRITTTPGGARVTVDGQAVGIAPITVPLMIGEHTITVSHPSHVETTRTVTVTKGDITIVDVPLAPVSAPARSKLPVVVMAAGGAALATGILLYVTSEEDTGEKFRYRDNRALGIGIGVVGVAAISVGAYMMMRGGSSDSAPAVALVPGGAYVGWARTF